MPDDEAKIKAALKKEAMDKAAKVEASKEKLAKILKKANGKSD